MNKYLVTMAGYEQGKNRDNIKGINRDYTKEAYALFESSKPYDFICVSYDNDWMKNSHYYKIAKDVLDKDSMGWAFKPIAIFDVLQKVKSDDVVMWVDSNHTFSENPDFIIDYAIKNGIFCHDHMNVYYPNMDFTHRDTFVNMNCDEERYWKSCHLQVNIMAFRKNNLVMPFVNEWLEFSLRYDTIIGNGVHPDFPSFREHRHEQSIFSILAEKYKVPYRKNIVGEGTNISGR
jgi:hypothetical protein